MGKETKTVPSKLSFNPGGVRPAPYKPELGLSHDELLSTATKDELLSTSQITKDLVSETDSKSEFLV